MKKYWDKPGKVGRTDEYSVTVSENWLEGQDLVTSTVTVNDETIVTAGAEVIVGNVIHIPLNFLAVGKTTVHVIFGTATRNDCVTVEVKSEHC